MTNSSSFLAIGMMSGTSMDGVDAALIKTDGKKVLSRLGGITIAYDDKTKDLIKSVLGRRPEQDEDGLLKKAAAEVTSWHVKVAKELIEKVGIDPNHIDVVGFHGHTVYHRPEENLTFQIGDGQKLADELGIDVVYRFRNADVEAGGQGAPLAPVYHLSLAEDMEKPLAILNLGGVGNVTFIDEDDFPIAFDTGPGNALIDDLVKKRVGESFDKDGKYASQGKVDKNILAKLCDNPYFELLPPKSLDRDDFAHAGDLVKDLSLVDAAATLSAFTARSVAKACKYCLDKPEKFIVCGGGSKNPTVMRMLREELGCQVIASEKVGWDSDMVEAELFGFMAVRKLLNLPISFPGTTGIKEAMCGGEICLHR